MDATLGQRLRELRHSRGLTLAEVAASASLSVSYINDIEHDRTVPALHRLVPLADAFGLSVVQLLEGVHPYDR